MRFLLLPLSACEVVAVEVRSEEAEQEVQQLAGVEAEADADTERGGDFEMRPVGGPVVFGGRSPGCDGIRRGCIRRVLYSDAPGERDLRFTAPPPVPVAP